MRLIDADALKEEITSHFDLELEPVIEKEALRMIDEQETISAASPKWVSVKDRMPNYCDTVIAVNIFGHISVAFYRGSGCFTDNNSGDELNYITHWMPLPETPDVKE